MSIPDAAPTVIFDTALNEQFNNFDFEYDVFMSQARDLGLSDQAISELTIHFSAQRKIDTDGDYSHSLRDIMVYPYAATSRIVNRYAAIISNTPTAYAESSVSPAICSAVSDTITHELVHCAHMSSLTRWERVATELSSMVVRLSLFGRHDGVWGIADQKLLPFEAPAYGIESVYAMDNINHPLITATARLDTMQPAPFRLVIG